MGQHIAALEGARTHPRVSDPVPVRRIHAGLHLEHEGAERCRRLAPVAVRIESPRRWRSQLGQHVEQLVDAEVERGGGEQHRARRAVAECLGIEVGVVGAEQFRFLDRGVPVHARGVVGLVRVDVLLGGCRGATCGAGEADVGSGAAIQHALEVARDADGPRQRRRLESDTRLDLVDQLQRVPARPVPLVDHRDDRDAAVTAHLEQLERLRFQTLGRVDQHHGRVDRGQYPVGVLGEVGVARGVEQVDHAGGAGLGDVRELQRRRRDRDAARLLHLHPVRDGGAAPCLAVDGAGLGDGLGVQHQGLGQRGFACVGMTDDGEGPSALRLGRQLIGPRAGGGSRHDDIDGIAAGGETKNR